MKQSNPDNSDDAVNRTSKNAVFNPQQALVLLEGDVNALKEFADVFIASSHDGIKQLQAFLANNDFEQMPRIAHGIKGAAASIGAQAIMTIAKGLENASKDKKRNVIDSLLARLKVELQRFETVIGGYDWSNCH